MKHVVSILIIALLAVLPVSAKMVVLFDEDANSEAGAGDFAALFTNHDAGSTVTVTSDEAFMGNSSAAATPSQSYNNAMAGWSYSVDEYPYLTFAWKKVGGTGIMIQFAHDSGWAYRYFSGENVTNWPGIQLETTIPENWVSYTRNLIDDFGGGWNLTGVAFTPWDGEAGYYDLIIMHSEPNEVTAVEPAGKLAATWAELKK